jgi:hypothetical protein
MIQRYNLAHIDEPFSDEEINTVIKEIPSDKSPRSDNFNGFFMKNCREAIKNDFKKLAHDFDEGNINLASINTAYISLIHKVNDPETMNDYRPISLVSLPLKFLTKLLDNIVQKRDHPMLH